MPRMVNLMNAVSTAASTPLPLTSAIKRSPSGIAEPKHVEDVAAYREVAARREIRAPDLAAAAEPARCETRAEGSRSSCAPLPARSIEPGTKAVEEDGKHAEYQKPTATRVQASRSTALRAAGEPHSSVAASESRNASPVRFS